MKDTELLQTNVDGDTKKWVADYCNKQVPKIKPAYLLRKLILEFKALTDGSSKRNVQKAVRKTSKPPKV